MSQSGTAALMAADVSSPTATGAKQVLSATVSATYVLLVWKRNYSNSPYML